jgi:hypothetical protein
MMPKNIHVTIDRLVLGGFPAEQRDGIAAALTATLKRELSEPGSVSAFGGSRSERRLTPAALKFERAASAGEIGTSAGRGLARSLRR